MNMANETISEKCETLYNKLNAFVTSVISRDVTPKISNLNTEVWGSDTQTGNSRIDTLNTNFNNLDGSITSMESDINNVESDVSNLQTSVNSLSDSITDINNTVNNHTTQFTNMIEVHPWGFTDLSISSGGTTTKTFTIPNPSGYYRLPLVQGAFKCFAGSLKLSGDTLTVKIHNQYSTNANASMYGKVLYIKSSIIKEI